MKTRSLQRNVVATAAVLLVGCGPSANPQPPSGSMTSPAESMDSRAGTDPTALWLPFDERTSVRIGPKAIHGDNFGLVDSLNIGHAGDVLASIDLLVDARTAVHPVRPGRIVGLKPDCGLVVVDHGDDLWFTYLHIDVNVSEGQSVSRTTVLGTVLPELPVSWSAPPGCSGLASTDPHLHLARARGAQPRAYVALAGTTICGHVVSERGDLGDLGKMGGASFSVPPCDRPTETDAPPTKSPVSTPTPTRQGSSTKPVKSDGPESCALLRSGFASLAPSTNGYRSNVDKQIESGCLVYMSTFAELYLVDTTSGAMIRVGKYGHPGMFDIARAPNGTMLGVADFGSTLVSIDPWTAETTSIGATGSGLNGLVVDRDGNVFGSGDSTLYRVDAGTGKAVSIGPTGDNPSAGDLAIDSLGRMFLSSDILTRVDPATGSARRLGSTTLNCVHGLAATPLGLFGGSCDGQLIVLDPDTGAFSVVWDGLLEWAGMT